MTSRWITTSCPSCDRLVKAVQYGNPPAGWAMVRHGPRGASCPASGVRFPLNAGRWQPWKA